jgi:hypothetical protein
VLKTTFSKNKKEGMMFGTGMNRFGNKVLANEGRISRFGTVHFMTIGRQVFDPTNMLYADKLLAYCGGKFRAEAARDNLVVLDSKSGVGITTIHGFQTYYVGSISRFKVMRGGWLALVEKGRRRTLPSYRRDLAMVRQAERGIKPSIFIERDYLKVDPSLYRRILIVLEIGHHRFPEYRVFDWRGEEVAFKQEYPLSYSRWEE